MTQPPDNAMVLAPDVWVDPDDLRWSFSRSGGPGGQAVNTLSTRAALRVAVKAIHGLGDEAVDRLRQLAGQRLTLGDELVITADTHRSQLDNRRACLRRLQALVVEAVNVPRPRRPTRPSRAAVEKRLDEKRRTSEKKGRRRRPGEE